MKKILTFIIFLVFTISLYALTLKGIWSNPAVGDFKNNLDQATKPFELSPERDRYALIMSLAHDHQFNLSETLADIAYPDVGYYEGRYYIYFAPGISLFALPFFLLGEQYQLAQVASFASTVLAAILAQIFLYRIAKDIFKLPLWASFFAVVIYAFGSTSWSYAVTLYQHHATAFLLLSAFYAAWYFKQKYTGSWLAAFYVWTAFGAAILIDYPNGFFFLPIMVYFFFSSLKLKQEQNSFQFSVRLAFFFSCIGFAALTVWHGYYNQMNFGSWHSLSSTLIGVKTIREKNLLNSVDAQKTIQNLASKKVVTKFFSEEKAPFGFYTLFFSLDRGLFLFSPIFILALLGIGSSMKKNTPELSTLLATAVCIIFLYSSWGDPWGGWAFGPRYLIPALPVFSLLIMFWVTQKKWQILRRIVALLLFMYSSAVALVGVLTTNAIPPKVEADFLHTGYNFLQNWKFLEKGASSSFVYNNFFRGQVSLLEYAGAIYGVLVVVAVCTLFILPRFTKHDN